MARKEVLAALFSLHGQAGVTLNNVADKVLEKVPGATHGEVHDALALRIKDGFEHEEFPSGVNMGLLNKQLSNGGRLAVADCVQG